MAVSEAHIASSHIKGPAAAVFITMHTKYLMHYLTTFML
jgi:hypothetical protein